MRLLAAFVVACAAHRLAHVRTFNRTKTLVCELGPNSVPVHSDFKPYSKGDHGSGLIPALNVVNDVEYYEIEEHTNLAKTSEYSFRRVDEDNQTAQCGRFHTHWLGRSADLRIGNATQKDRLVRITSARHGNAWDNRPFQVYYVRDKQKKTYYTIVRKRVSKFQYLIGAPGSRKPGLNPVFWWYLPKITTHVYRNKNKGKPDLFQIFVGKCKYGGRKPSQEPECGEQLMTGIGAFGEWKMNWYMGAVTGNTKLEDAVATLHFQEEKWGNGSLHKKQIFRLAVKSGDVGVIVINAFLADILRAMELLNKKRGHNPWSMDMR